MTFENGDFAIRAGNAARRRLLRLAVACAAVCAGFASAWADEYPSKPVRMIVPWPAGGSSDSAGRIVAERLGAELKTNIIIDNRGGAGGRIGVRAGLQSPPDGYTMILINSSTNVALPVTDPAVGFDPVTSFSLLAPIALVPAVLIAPPAFPAANLREFIEHAKKNPGKVTYASYGPGSTPHLTTELFAGLAGISLLHVSYKGGAQAKLDILAGRVDALFTDFGVLEDIRSGRLKALVTNAPARVPMLPDLPTALELGFNGFDRVGWHGLAFPAGTPDAMVKRVLVAINSVLGQKDVMDRLAGVGMTPGGGAPAEFAKRISADVSSFRDLAKRLDLKFNN